MSKRKRVILMHVTWAGGCILAWLVSPHYPLWGQIVGMIAGYFFMFYLWFYLWSRASERGEIKRRENNGTKTTNASTK
jgi:hypothetical protein